MTSAISRSGTPSSPTACSRAPAGADSRASRYRRAASSRCTRTPRVANESTAPRGLGEPWPVRADTAAAALAAAGAEMHRGALKDLKSLGEVAAASDGVVHAAFNAVRSGGNVGTETDYAAAVQAERRAIAALGEAHASDRAPDGHGRAKAPQATVAVAAR